MKRKAATIAFTSFAFVIALATVSPAHAQEAKTRYPNMAPLEQYLMGREAEIALARSAAPSSISHDAEVLVLGRHGYETAVKGKNGFVCTVQRSWTAPLDDPDFWNPKLRAPICFNAPAARSYLSHAIRKTEFILATRSKAQMANGIAAALDKKELRSPEPGAMCYMMSRQGYLSDRDGHWHPHLMFFLPPTDPASWGSGKPGAPLIGVRNDLDRVTVFLIPVAEWSDGTAASKE
jgi:hypothetical protein